jgi:site-specific recombinase XerD
VCATPAGGKITRSAIEHISERWLRKELRIDERSGTHLHPHKLRTTFATYFVWSGGSTNTLQKLMGHADINTTQHYVLSDDEQKAHEIRQLKFTRS